MKWHKEELKKFSGKTKGNYPEFTTVNGTVVISQIFRMIISGEWTYEKALKGLGRKIVPDAYNFDRKIAIESGDYSQDRKLQDLINRELPKYCGYAIQGEVLICSMWGPNGGVAIYQDFAGRDTKEMLPVLELDASDYYKFMLEILEGHKDNQLTKVLKDVTFQDSLRMIKNEAFELASKLEGYEENIKRIFELIQVAYRYGQGWSTKIENVQYTENRFGCVVVKCKENFVSQHEFTKDLIMYLKDHKNRYKLGQFFTVSEHARKVAEKVWEVHQRTGLKMKESTVGTGAITIELIRIIKQVKGSEWREYCKRFLLSPSDIDPVFASVAEQLINVEGLDYKVEVKDVFDIEKFDWIEYGNPPYNKSRDRNYLARMIRYMTDHDLEHFVFMTNATLVDNKTQQQKRILEKGGKEFYTHIQHFLKDDDKNYGCSVSFTEYDNGVKFQDGKNIEKNFDLLGDLNVNIHDLPSTDKRLFKDGSKIYRDDLDPRYSILYMRQGDLEKTVQLAIPSPTAPAGTKEKELYDRWIKEGGTYPKNLMKKDQLLIGSYSRTVGKYIPLKYFENVVMVGTRNVVQSMTGEKKLLGVVGLILQSSTFKIKLYKLFPKAYNTQYVLHTKKLRTMPIPKQISQRLYDIGMEVIVKGNENDELRKEADEIIEKLYRSLEI